MKFPRLTTIAGLAALIASLGIVASAQTNPNTTYFFSTFAGTTGGPDILDGVGTAARFNTPNGIAVDQAGNIYVADHFNHTIRKITPGGTVTTLAGTAGVAGSTDGSASTALFCNPMGLAVDRSGNLYVDDFGNSTIRKISSSGVVSTVAGKAGVTGSSDGIGEAARFNYPYDVAVDDDGNLYVADLFNYAIRKITPDRVVSTLNARDLSRLVFPGSLALDAQKNIYVADLGLCTIAKVSPTGTVTILAGIPATPGGADGPSQSATFSSAKGVTVDRLGNVYVSDTYNQTIRKITPDGTVTTFAGTKGIAGSVDGRGAEARFTYATDLTTDDAGNLYVADGGNQSVRKITPDALVTTLAGAAGLAGTSDGSGTAARFRFPESVATDQAGNIYVADTENYIVRKITADGNVTTLAGKPGVYGHQDGTGAEARFSYPKGIAVDPSGNVYIADNDFLIKDSQGIPSYFSGIGSTIRKITSGGVVTTLAGRSGAYGKDDGLGAAALFNRPEGLAADANGNIYVADTYNSAIRKITPEGLVTTLAQVPALGNCLTMDGAGNLFVVANGTINKISPAGVVTSWVGSAASYGNVDGTGSDARFSASPSIAADAAGNVFVADYGNQTIRKITPAGVVTTIAGKYQVIGNATGAGTDAHFYLPEGIAVDRTGNLFVANTFNHNIRKGVPAGPPVISAQPQSQSVAAGGNVQFSVTAGGVPAPTYQWYFNGAAFSGGTASTLSFTNVRSADAGDYTVIVTNSLGSVTSTKATLTVSASSTGGPSTGSPASGGGGGSIGVWFVVAAGALGVARSQFMRRQDASA